MSKKIMGFLKLIEKEEKDTTISSSISHVGLGKQYDNELKKELVELCGYTQEEAEEYLRKANRSKIEDAAEQVDELIRRDHVVIDSLHPDK